jgi:hypothetical protein
MTRRVDNDAPVYPVRDVQSTVCTQRGEVVRRDWFCFACALEDEELREDSNSLEEDGEGPGYFCDGVRVVEEEPENESGADKVLDTEGIDGRVVSWPETGVRVNAMKLSDSQAKEVE